MTDALATIPDEARMLFDVLRQEPLLSRNELELQVDVAEGWLQAAEPISQVIDIALCAQIATGCRKLLTLYSEGRPEVELRLIQAAVRYFALEDDASGDTGSPGGLVDDAQVLNAVLNHLGQGEWQVPLS